MDVSLEGDSTREAWSATRTGFADRNLKLTSGFPRERHERQPAVGADEVVEHALVIELRRRRRADEHTHIILPRERVMISIVCEAPPVAIQRAGLTGPIRPVVPKNATRCQSLMNFANASRFERSPPCVLRPMSYAPSSENFASAFSTLWSSKPGLFSIL